MRVIALIVCSAALGGCASAVLTPEQARAEPAVELCYGLAAYRPENASVAQQEIARRGVDCAEHQSAVAALVQARNTPVAGVNQVQTPRQCRSIMIGNTMRTQCN